jgi:hypothetical protein
MDRRTCRNDQPAVETALVTVFATVLEMIGVLPSSRVTRPSKALRSLATAVTAAVSSDLAADQAALMLVKIYGGKNRDGGATDNSYNNRMVSDNKSENRCEHMK